MDTFLLYLVLKADDIQTFLGVGGLCLMIATLICTGCLIDSYDWRNEYSVLVKRNIKIALACAGLMSFLLFFTSLLMPNTKQLAVLFTVPKATHAISSNKKIQAISDKILDLANKKLDEAIKGG